MIIQCTSSEFSVISKIKAILLDRDGDKITDSDGYYISLSILQIDGYSSLSGVSSKPFINGEAVFDDMCINTNGTQIDIINIEE
jgi:hypothetical protein